MATKKSRSAAAKKANTTRKKWNRISRDLTSRYGEDTAFVVVAALRGDKTGLQTERNYQGTGRVAAILANLTRGAYDDLL